MNDSHIQIEIMEKLSQADDYFDDELFERIKDDDCKDIKDVFSSGLHLIAKKEERPIGIVSFITFSGRCIVIHPKIKQSHMIYAQRVLKLAIDYLKDIMKFDALLAVIPDSMKGNIKMAEKMGMSYSGIIPASIRRDGKYCDQLIYSMGV